MMCPPRVGRVCRCMLHESDRDQRVLEAVPTLTRGAVVLMSVQGAAGLRYIPLAPLSTMEVSVLGSLSSYKGGGGAVIIRRNASVCQNI